MEKKRIRLGRLFSFDDIEGPHPLTFRDELKGQCDKIILPASVIAFFIWIAYIPVDIVLNPGNPIIVYFRVGLSVVSLILILLFKFGKALVSSMILVAVLGSYLLGATAVLTAVSANVPVYFGGYLFVLMLPIVAPLPRKVNWAMIWGSVAVFVVVGIATKMEFSSYQGRYRMNDLIGVTIVATVFTYSLDRMRYRSWMKEEKLLESERRLADIIDFLPLPTMVIDKESHITIWNRAMEEMTRVRASDMIGKGDYEYGVPFYGERRRILIDYVFEKEEVLTSKYKHISLDGGTLSAEAFIPMLGKNGVTLVGHASSIRDLRGNVVGAIESLRDMTEIREVEREMARAKDAAEAANKSKSEFLANMSHEIRTPMNAIIGLSHLALKSNLDIRQRDYLLKIDNAAHNLLKLINDILDFSKIEAGKLDVERTPFRLEDVMGNLSTVISVKAYEKGLELIFDTQADIPNRLIGDPLRLNQILVNLCSNAVKFTEKGEIVVRTRLVERKDDKVRIEFSVIDTGIGLKEDQIGKLFTSFSQADSSTTRKYGGTGLGLSISRRLVELMGGTISVESRYGSGSAFRFDALFQVQAGPEVSLTDSIKDLLGMRVLVVDDNQSARQILREMMEKLAFRVGVCATGEEAISALKNASNRGESYDLVLMDWKMPGIDGLEASKRIKSDPTLSKTPAIIIITAYGPEELANKVDKIRLEGFLMKPISPSTFIDTLVTIFHGSPETVGTARQPQGEDPVDIVRGISGARILLAEDNDMNQQVAIELLEGAGFSVTLAVDGKDAVDKMSADFHLVLMDIQMPNMDGYEAARIIRSKPEFDGVPIVAMTANAMEQDLEKARRAGMVSHVAKPVDPVQLYRTLAELIRPDPAKPFNPARAERDNARPGSSPADIVRLPARLPGIDIGDGLSHLAGNVSAYIRLLRQFPERQGSCVDSIRTSLEKNQKVEAVRIAHSTKSVAGNLGAKGLFAASREVESVLKEEKDATEVIASMERSLREVVEGLQKWEKTLPTTHRPAGVASAPALDRLRKRIASLEELLKDNDTASIHMIDEMILMGIEATAGILAAMKKQAENYDFEAALGTMGSLKELVGGLGK